MVVEDRSKQSGKGIISQGNQRINQHNRPVYWRTDIYDADAGSNRDADKIRLHMPLSDAM